MCEYTSQFDVVLKETSRIGLIFVCFIPENNILKILMRENMNSHLPLHKLSDLTAFYACIIGILLKTECLYFAKNKISL